MKKRKIPKLSKRRLAIFGTFSIIMIIYFFMTLSVNAIKIYNLKVERQLLNKQLSNLQASEKNLKVEIEKLKDSDYLAKYARENYKYSKEGELVFSLPDIKNSLDEDIKKIEFNTNYILFIGSSIIGIIILYALRKHR